MRTRLSFALTALTLLFFLQALSALLGVTFALVYQGIFSELDIAWLALALVPVGALLAPALPFSLWVERSTLVIGAAVVAASARVFLSMPSFSVRFLTSSIVVASGAIFLGKAVGFLDRRTVAAGAATAVVLDALLRLAGWSYDVSQRPGWVPVQLIVSVAAIGIALKWRMLPESGQSAEPTLERRAGGVRLRGALAFGCILFLQLNVLARAELAHRLLGVAYPAASVALIAAGGAAVLLLLAAPGPIGSSRSAAVFLAALALAGALSPLLNAVPAVLRLILFAAGHAAALLLIDRALVPAFGRRRGWRLAAGLGMFFVLTLAWALTFYYAFTVPAFQGRTGLMITLAVMVLVLALVLSPRPVHAPPVLRRPRHAAAGFVGLLALAALFAHRPHSHRPANEPGAGVGIGTFNIHYGFSEDWQYDPERIARTIEESGASVVALQEVTAGMMTAYGTDMALWLGRRLGMHSLFAPAINGLLGDALLTRLPVLSFTSAPLPPRDADRKVLVQAQLAASPDTLTVYAVHFGVVEDEQRVQLAAALPSLTSSARSVLVGDLNAGPSSEVAVTLRNAGYRDAFELAGVTGEPTWPASRPAERIDWIWVRGYGVFDAVVSRGAGSDHRLVTARLRPR
ncbi:MAG: endonuclease/exonuclease/phosphatase family protein [Longimicrobiales bacterium]